MDLKYQKNVLNSKSSSKNSNKSGSWNKLKRVKNIEAFDTQKNNQI